MGKKKFPGSDSLETLYQKYQNPRLLRRYYLRLIFVWDLVKETFSISELWLNSTSRHLAAKARSVKTTSL